MRCSPRTPKFVFMRPSKLLTSLMRPVSHFEFETPGLEEVSLMEVRLKEDRLEGVRLEEVRL